MPNYFIAGTDTGVGKTFVSAALLAAAAQRGLRAFGLKPVAAGCYQTAEGWRNEDAVLLKKYSSVDLPYSQVNPLALRDAIAPHIAAAREGRQLRVERIEGFCRGALMTPADLRLIEGAGGWRVPLNSVETMATLAVRLQTPVILVVGMRLGCINHALLSAEAIRADGLPLVGWVANSPEPEMPAFEENLNTLCSLMPAPCLGSVPAGSEITDAAKRLQLSALIKT